MESKRMISEELQRQSWKSEEERQTVVKEKVGAFLGEESERLKSEKLIVGAKAKWALWFGMAEKPKEMAEASIDRAYSKVFQEKSLGKSQKSKRAAAFNEKERRQNLAYAEMYQYHTIRDKAVNLIAEESAKKESKQDFLEGTNVAKSKYAEATQDIAVYAYLSQQESAAELAKKFFKSAASSETQDSAPELLVREMEKLDLSEFEYESDGEFATGLSLKMAKIRAFSHVTDYLREIRLGRLSLTGDPVDITALTAKARMLESIKTDYENRMLMMQSPYYVLLAKKDTDGLNEKELDGLVDGVKNEELRAYVGAFKKMKKNKLFEKGGKTTDKEKKLKSSLEKQSKAVDGDLDALVDELKEFAKEKDFKYETGHCRAGILTLYYYDKYGADGATDIKVFIDNFTAASQNAKLSSSQKKKFTQMLTDLNETATMFEYLKRQSDTERKNDKGGVLPVMDAFRDQGFKTLAIQSPAFRVLAERLQAERDKRAHNNYDTYNNKNLNYVITAPDKSGFFKNRIDSKNSITAQEVYNNKIELIRYKKEKGIEPDEDEKKLIGGSAEINEEEIAKTKKKLGDIAEAKLRVVANDFLNSDKPFIDVERDWMNETSKEMERYRDEHGGLYRKDVAGIDRMEHHAKYKNGGPEMQKDAEEDVENLVRGLQMDKQLSIPDMNVEEPLLTALKGYMMFMMIGENAIMSKAKEKELVKNKVELLSGLVSKNKDEESPEKAELAALRKDLERLGKEDIRISAFSLRYKTSIPISLAYLPNVLKLQSYAEARQIIMQEEDGVYKQHLLKTLDEKEAALKKTVEVNKISAYKTVSNGVDITITDNQKDMIKKLSAVFDSFTKLRERKAQGDGKDTKTIEDEALEQLKKALEIVMDYNKVDKA